MDRKRYKVISWDGYSARLPNRTCKIFKPPTVDPACLECAGSNTQCIYEYVQVGMWEDEQGLVLVCPDCWHTSTYYWLVPTGMKFDVQ